MKLIFVFTPFLVFCCLGCQSELGEEASPKDEGEVVAKPAVEKDEDGIGMSETEAAALAKERGLVSRGVSVDGEARPVTMDYLLNRIYFTIEIGKVVKVNRG